VTLGGHNFPQDFKTPWKYRLTNCHITRTYKVDWKVKGQGHNTKVSLSVSVCMWLITQEWKNPRCSNWVNRLQIPKRTSSLWCHLRPAGKSRSPSFTQVTWLIVTKVRSESFGPCFGLVTECRHDILVLCAVNHTFAYWASFTVTRIIFSSSSVVSCAFSALCIWRSSIILTP